MSSHHIYLPFLEQVLTPARLAHSLGVMQVMGELADIYALDKDKAQTIGILHDAAKDLPQAKIDALIKEGNIRLMYECETNYVLYLHGPVGAYFIQKELGIQDELILDVIRAHTYFGDGLYFNHPMTWCMRFSDVLEPTRNWSQEKIVLDCATRLRELAYSGKMKEGAYLETGCIIRWFEEKGMPVHPAMRRINHELGIELGLDLKEGLCSKPL
jgi:predicted HD superfamily hydrolase involved in NAD metabolism